MKTLCVVLGLSALLLAGCGSAVSSSGQDPVAIVATSAKKPVPTADECRAKSTDEERSDCMYDRTMRTPLNSPHARPAPVIDPLLGKPIGAADSTPAPASSSARG